MYQVEDVCEEEMPEESEDCVRMDRTPPPPTLSPAAITVGRGEDLTSEHPLLGEEVPKIGGNFCEANVSNGKSSFFFHWR